MNKVKVKLLKTILIIMISGALAYVVCKALTLLFQSMNNIHKLIKIVKSVVNCL